MVVSKANRNVVEAMTGNRRHRRIVSPALIIMDGSIAIGAVSVGAWAYAVYTL